MVKEPNVKESSKILVINHFQDLLRQYIKDKKDGHEEIDNQMKEGKLISSETLMKVLKSYIVNSRNKKILVDG